MRFDDIPKQPGKSVLLVCRSPTRFFANQYRNRFDAVATVNEACLDVDGKIDYAFFCDKEMTLNSKVAWTRVENFVMQERLHVKECPSDTRPEDVVGRDVWKWKYEMVDASLVPIWMAVMTRKIVQTYTSTAALSALAMMGFSSIFCIGNEDANGIVSSAPYIRVRDAVKETAEACRKVYQCKIQFWEPKLREAFRREGFVVLRSIFTPSEIEDLRHASELVFRKTPQAHDQAHLRFDPVNRDDEIRWAAFHPPLVSAMRELFGDVVYFSEHSLLRDYYRSGFHADTIRYRNATGDSRVCDADYQIARPAIYLQSNSDEHGGGIDVKPGSHRGRQGDATTVFHEVGDVVVWNLNLLHQATVAARQPPKKKIALFLAAGPRDDHAERFAAHLRNTDGCFPLEPATLLLCNEHQITWM